MRKLSLVLTALCAISAFAAVTASSSLAAVSQVLCDGLTVTAATSAECLGTATGTGFLLEESLTKLDITCETVTADLVPAAGGTDIAISEVKFSGCKTLGFISCTVTALNQPWLSAITLSGTAFLGSIQSSGVGTPEYLATCAGTSVQCSAALATGGAEDYQTTLSTLEGGKLHILFGIAEEGKCGAESKGTLEGLFVVSGVLTFALSEV